MVSPLLDQIRVGMANQLCYFGGCFVYALRMNRWITIAQRPVGNDSSSSGRSQLRIGFHDLAIDYGGVIKTSTQRDFYP